MFPKNLEIWVNLEIWYCFPPPQSGLHGGRGLVIWAVHAYQPIMHASRQENEARPEVVYLDNNATTRVAPEVFEAMVPFLTEYYGNPSSAYSFGKLVEGHLKEAREKVAALLGCTPKEIIFTSCGTESDNAAIWSALQTSGKKHVVTTQVEHSAIMNQTDQLERMGFGVTRLPVQPDGTLDVAEVEKA